MTDSAGINVAPISENTSGPQKSFAGLLLIENCGRGFLEIEAAMSAGRSPNCELRIANFAARDLICQALLRKFAVFFAAVRVAYQYNCNMVFHILQEKE